MKTFASSYQFLFDMQSDYKLELWNVSGWRHPLQ